jgi:hypothetical protein
LKQGEGLPSKGRNASFSAGFVACGRDAQTESYFFEFWQQVFIGNKLRLHGSCQGDFSRSFKEKLVSVTLSIGERCDN